MATAVFGIATSYSRAEVMIDALKEAGFANHDISVLFSDQEGPGDFACEKNTRLRKALGGDRRACLREVRI